MNPKPKTKKPTFNIYRADGSKCPTLRRCFIIRMDVSWNDRSVGSICLPDGTLWDLTIEDQADQAIQDAGRAYCIVSFQVHEHGNFAIARFYDPRKLTAARTNNG